MIRKVSVAALAVLGCSAAGAAADSRIRSLAYDPDRIVQVVGEEPEFNRPFSSMATNAFENVAVGNSSKWQVTPNHGARVCCSSSRWPRAVRTNMTVVTDRRTYMFDLVAGDESTTPVYALKFSYPNEKRRSRR